MSLAIATVIGLTTWQLGWWGGLEMETWWPGRGHRVADRMRIEEGIVNLSATFDRGAVVVEAEEAPVHIGRLQPGFKWRVNGRHRHAIIAPPPSLLRFRLDVPGGTRLRFAAGVESDGKRDPNAQGVRFAVWLNDREVFAQVINPAATRHDRRWFDVRVDVPTAQGEPLEIELHTQAVGGGTRLAGKPGWSHVRLVRETVHDRQQASATTPNVLVLLVDTLRADRLGCYGAEPSPSPALDELARGGLLFQEVTAQSAWTMPSVASIFTGLHPRSHGLVGVAMAVDEPAGGQPDAGKSDPSYLSDQLPTLARQAQLAGITTVGVSGNPLVSRGTNLARGFETFVEFGLDGRGWHPAKGINRAFLRWLNQNSRHRFFGYLHYMDIHDPYKPPDEYLPVPRNGLRPRIARGEVAEIAKRIHAGGHAKLTQTELEYLRELYDAQIRYWDAEFRALLDGLSAAGVREKTVVIVTSDHGEEFLEHGRLKHGAHLYDELISVPLVIGGTAIRPGRAREQAQGIDLFPTIAGLLGVEVPAGLPGRNLLENYGARAAISETRWGVDPNGVTTPLVSLRTRAWKLIHAPELDHFELYDLTRDPAERENHFGKNPESARLVQKLAEWRETAPPAPPVVGRDPQFRDKLRSLGYIE